jgi:predicted phage terminase large subunit-like protein
VLLCREETFYVLDVVRGKFPFDQLKRKIIEVKQSYGPSTLIIEESPISHGLIQSLRESRINVVTVRPDKDKRSRVISQSDLFEGGSVLFPEKAPWLEDLEHELLAFPGRHDDQVDALIQGLAYKREEFGFQQSGRHFGLI